MRAQNFVPKQMFFFAHLASIDQGINAGLR
jgi:hypothetical protein